MIKTAEQKGYEAVVYEAAILFQYGQPEKFDAIVLVLADENKRIERVSRRNGTDKKRIQARIKKQENFENLINKADIAIRNNGTLKQLENKAEEVYKNLVGEQ